LEPDPDADEVDEVEEKSIVPPKKKSVD